MISISIDTGVALKQFVKRYQKYQGKQIDNSTLYAGSPMHYYCQFCGKPTETLPEGHRSRPKVKCDPCVVIESHGLMDDALDKAKEATPARTG